VREGNASKPNFSGEYLLDRQASTLSPGAAAVRRAVLRIEHREPFVRIKARFEFEANTFEYSLERVSDGREVVDQAEGRTISSLRWEDSALMFVDRTDGPDSQVTMSWRYELQDAGRRLTAIERIRGGGRDQDNVWIFERR
jgi:hypothetical protein